MDVTDYVNHDATALAQLVQRGEVSATQLLDLALARVAAVNPRINALTQRLLDDARSRAAELDRSRPARPGQPGRSPDRVFEGVPFLLKDSDHDYAGTPTTMGSKAFSRTPAPQHSVVVQRFLDAGLVIFGKTNLSELALKASSENNLYGRTNNPWDVGRVPGGSSGGAAAAVASGMVPMAAASDGGGSIRIPAACCALVGLKASRGRISNSPHSEGWNGAAVNGVLSRSVRDTAAALDVLCGPAAGDQVALPAPSVPFAESMKTAPGRLRVGLTTTSPIGTPVDDDAVAAVHHAAELLRGLGHEVREAAPAVDGHVLAQDYMALYFGYCAAVVAQGRSQGAKDGDFELLTRLLAAFGEVMSAGRFTTHLDNWSRHSLALADFHRDHDLYLSPVLASAPVVHGTGELSAAQERVLDRLHRSRALRPVAASGAVDKIVAGLFRDGLEFAPFTQLANLTGAPAISLPLYWNSAGLPLGVQFMAAPGRDDLLLQLSSSLEQVQPWFDRLPTWVREAA